MLSYCFFKSINVYFSIASDSPVNEDCETNKSLACKILTSAGIISPAAKWIISPTMISEIGISLKMPFRCTSDVVSIILTGLYASIINYFYFKNYQNEKSWWIW